MRIPGHKFIVKLGSPVLYNSLSGNWSEMDEQVITDFDPSPFLSLLRFMYMDEIVFELKYLYDVLALSKKYMVEGITGPLTSGNEFRLLAQEKVWSFLMYGIFHSERDLIKRCWKYIDEECETAVTQDDFFDLDDRMLEELLDRDSLRVDEITLFNACVKWSGKECARQRISSSAKNRRSVMDPFIRKIRFPLMSATEFGEGPAVSEILTHKEVSELFRSITLNKRDMTDFAHKPRAGKTDQKTVNWSLFLCTYLLTGRSGAPLQHFYRCVTCDYDDVCIVCVHKCHQGHTMKYTGSFRVRFCDCGYKKACAGRSDVHDVPVQPDEDTDDTDMEGDGSGDDSSSVSTVIDTDGGLNSDDNDEPDDVDFNDL